MQITGIMSSAAGVSVSFRTEGSVENDVVIIAQKPSIKTSLCSSVTDLT